MACATVNVPEIPVHENDGEVLIKDYSENKGILSSLVNAGVIVDTRTRFPVGLCEVALCYLTTEARKLVDDDDLQA